MLVLLLAIGSGATAMYFSDAAKGKKRRVGLRIRLQGAYSNSGRFLSAAGRDFGHRARGIKSVLQRSLRDPKNIESNDAKIIARVHSKIGRLVSRPHAIAVAISNGQVTLSGPLPAQELSHLVRQISKLPGVRGVKTNLVVYRHGVETKKFDRFELLQKNWSPAARLLVLVSSTFSLAMGLLGLRHRRVFSALLATVSTGFIARALSNIDSRRLFGVNSDSNAITVRKTINICAPIFRVYRYMTDLANFSHFMTDVVEVTATGNNRFHWVVRGLAGFPVSWNAVISRHIPNEVLAWRSEPGALVKHAGQIRFSANKDGSTQINVELSYCPPGGALGHAAAKLLGDDPKSKMNEDLMRLKTLIESGPSARQRSRGIVMH